MTNWLTSLAQTALAISVVRASVSSVLGYCKSEILIGKAMPTYKKRITVAKY